MTAGPTADSLDRGQRYSLIGPRSRLAEESGLAEGAWFTPPVEGDRLATLQHRTDGRALADLALWLVLLVGLGTLVVITWWSWWTVPALVVYGALYGGSADARWHEMGHNTAFRTQWLNDMVYYLASFMLWREPAVWRWSHYRHHTDTLVVGRDIEIAFKRPTPIPEILAAFGGVNPIRFLLPRLLRHAAGGRDPEVESFVPSDEWPRVHREARFFVAVLALAAAAAVVWWTPLPVVLVGLPTVYGSWLMVFFGITQHAGLREDVLDHRLNTRTVYMNPVFRFLYLNMNYHVEHHLFPTVPYYALPALHDELRPYLAPPLPTTVAAYREIFTALTRQRRDPGWEIPDRSIPEVDHADRAPIVVSPVSHHDGAVVVPIGQMAVGTVRRIDVGERTVALYRLGPNEFRATDGLCTHGRADLARGVVIDCELIECPKHNGRFDIRTGEPARRPAKDPLMRYPVEVHEQSVHVTIGSLGRSVGQGRTDIEQGLDRSEPAPGAGTTDRESSAN